MIKDVEEKLINKEKLTKDEINILLDYIVSSIRNIINNDTFINKCDAVQGLIGRYLNCLGITNYPCITNKCIMPNVVGHSFIVAAINDYNYIIDPSFVQFAYIEFDELYINHLRIESKSPFSYAANINKSMLKELIEKGYIELNKESAYWYGNSFYHTLTNIKDDYIFNDICGEAYINNFFKGNEELREYDYPEIDITFKSSKNK